MKIPSPPRALWGAIMLVAVAALVVLPEPPFGIRSMLGVVFLFAALCLIASHAEDPLDVNTALSLTEDSLNPWAMQRELMRASDQQLPDSPALTKGSLMYSALVLEEVSETFIQGITPALDRLIAQLADSAVDANVRHALKVIRGKLRVGASAMEHDAKAIRGLLADVPEFEMPLTRTEAVPLLDGATDSAVVICGLSESCGLPGAAAYEEVAGSNLSKRNPDTGVIDKHPDGKWIKGRDYRAPDLAEVLAEAQHLAPGYRAA